MKLSFAPVACPARRIQPRWLRSVEFASWTSWGTSSRRLETLTRCSTLLLLLQLPDQRLDSNGFAAVSFSRSFHFMIATAAALAVIIGALAIVSVAWAQGGVGTLLEQARVAEKISDYATATRIYEQALALSPGNLEVLKRFGVLEQTELKFDSSISHFQQVLARESQYPEVNFFLGMSYFGKGEFQRAIRQLRTGAEKCEATSSLPLLPRAGAAIRRPPPGRDLATQPDDRQ